MKLQRKLWISYGIIGFTFWMIYFMYRGMQGNTFSAMIDLTLSFIAAGIGILWFIDPKNIFK